ncbi:ABC transporter ATP-binding protein [Halalkalirubrum salinum]|uniref:ABC transporter ATP-binding protein n=1 Tax=Halalkalirubrum salinum TaxID=2563889 RepID=UPI0010FB6D61|nr:ABC transporter ATP-binding protein [Halalkalirubrum salinum]
MILELDRLTHRYGDELVIEDVSFGLNKGELVALLGPSGCGKTTIVQTIAGHVQPTAGQVLLRDRDVTREPPENRHVGVVFQQSTLYPHMTVSKNVAYGLKARGIEPNQLDERVSQYLELVDLSEQRTAYPSELSGGQQRRVELARALAPEPDVLLLDEPLSALDRQLRTQLREEIARIQNKTGVTTLFVTHDQEEAMALADRLIVINDGHVSGSGTPRTLYESPPTPFVASFLGRSNVFPAVIASQRPLTLRVGHQELVLPNRETTASVGARVMCHVRPPDLALSSTGPTGGNDFAHSLTGEVVSVADVGCRYDVRIKSISGDAFVVEASNSPPEPGEMVTVELPRDQITIFKSKNQDYDSTIDVPETEL